MVQMSSNGTLFILLENQIMTEIETEKWFFMRYFLFLFSSCKFDNWILNKNMLPISGNCEVFFYQKWVKWVVKPNPLPVGLTTHLAKKGSMNLADKQKVG